MVAIKERVLSRLPKEIEKKRRSPEEQFKIADYQAKKVLKKLVAALFFLRELKNQPEFIDWYRHDPFVEDLVLSLRMEALCQAYGADYSSEFSFEVERKPEEVVTQEQLRLERAAVQSISRRLPSVLVWDLVRGRFHFILEELHQRNEYPTRRVISALLNGQDNAHTAELVHSLSLFSKAVAKYRSFRTSHPDRIPAFLVRFMRSDEAEALLGCDDVTELLKSEKVLL